MVVDNHVRWDYFLQVQTPKIAQLPRGPILNSERGSTSPQSYWQCFRILEASACS